MSYEVAYQVFGRDDRVETRRKAFKTEKAMLAFIARIEQSANFYRILACAA